MDICEGTVMSSIKMMSNNIWYIGDNDPRWEAKGEDCSAEQRSKGFVKVYSELLPDIIGLQESTSRLSYSIMKGLNAESLPYAMVWGADTPIIYRKDKFELIDSDFLLYPEECPGYEGSFNNNETKSYCIGVFRKKDDGKLLIFATTHLWWKLSDLSQGEENYQPFSDEAREYQLGLLISKVSQFKEKHRCPAVIVGDFNTEYNSKAVQSALNEGYYHAYDIALEHRDETCGFHYCYPDGYEMFDDKKTFFESIDHILLSDAPKDSVKRFDRYYPDYYMPLSDHFPVLIEFEF